MTDGIAEIQTPRSTKLTHVIFLYHMHLMTHMMHMTWKYDISQICQNWCLNDRLNISNQKRGILVRLVQWSRGHNFFFIIHKSHLIHKNNIFPARLPQYEKILPFGQANRTQKADFLTILKTEYVTGTHFFHIIPKSHSIYKKDIFPARLQKY